MKEGKVAYQKRLYDMAIAAFVEAREMIETNKDKLRGHLG